MELAQSSGITLVSCSLLTRKGTSFPVFTSEQQKEKILGCRVVTKLLKVVVEVYF